MKIPLYIAPRTLPARDGNLPEASIPRVKGRVRDLLQRNTRFHLALILVLAFAIHLFNLSGYPAFFIDEGAYISRAIVFSRTGDPTAPAGTFYFHPFLTWVLMGLIFSMLNFPAAWNSNFELLYLLPRSLFVILGVLDVFLVYIVVQRVYQRTDYALLASSLLAVTPLSVRYLRMVLLDSLMVFFILLSIAILYRPHGKRRAILSGLIFGLAMLSKLVAVFFVLPFLLLFLSKELAKFSHQADLVKARLRQFAQWAVAGLLVTAIWPGYALWTSQWQGLVNSLAYQTSREEALPIDLILSRIVERDIFLFAGLAGVLYGLWKKDILGGLISLSYLGTFILTGLRVSSYYLVPALPFLSILAARFVIDSLEYSSHQLSRLNVILPKFSNTTISIILVGVLAFSGFSLAGEASTQSQVESMNYVIDNAPDGSLVISSPAYSWAIRELGTSLIVYDWFGAPWNSLPSSPPKTYLLVDPGFSIATDQIPELQQLYDQTMPETVFGQGSFSIMIRTTTAPLVFP